MTEASAEAIAFARSDLDLAVSSAGRVYRLARALSVAPTEAAFQEALRTAAPDVIECARRVSSAAAALGVASTGTSTSSAINGPWATDPPEALVGPMAGVLRDAIQGASGISDSIEDQITEIDEEIAAIKRQAEGLARLGKATQALVAKVMDAIGTDRPAECGEVPAATEEIDDPDEFFRVLALGLRGEVAVPPREFEEEPTAAAEAGYADPFDTPQANAPTEYKASAAPTDPSQLVGKFTPPTRELVEPKDAPPPTDPSELVGKFTPPTRELVEPKDAPPPTDPSELVGKFTPPTREQTQTAVPVPVAKRSAGDGSRSRWSWLLLPIVLLLAIVVIGVLAVGLGVFNSGLTPGEVKSPSPLTGDSTATPAASAVIGGSPSPSSSVGASPSAAPTTQAPSPSATEPVPSSQPTPTPIKPTPTVAPTNSPKPTPTPSPPKGTTPPPVVSFKVTPQQVSTSCKDLAAFDISLNNNGSNVAVDWSIKFAGSSYSGEWGSAKPQSGTLDPGAVGTVTITPQADLCASLTSVEEFVLEVGYGGDTPETVTYRLTP